MGDKPVEELWDEGCGVNILDDPKPRCPFSAAKLAKMEERFKIWNL